MVSVPSPPCTSARRPSAAIAPADENVSLPAFAFRSSRSDAVMSMLNGPGPGVAARSKRASPGVADALSVNASSAFAPFTVTVSLPGPPSLRSSSSPPFQIIVSSPSPPSAVSRVPAGLSSSVIVSLPASPAIRSTPSSPTRVSSPSPPLRSSAKPSAASPPSASSVSLPARPLKSSFSDVPMSRLNGPGGVGPVRSKATRPGVADGLTVKSSLPPPFTSTTSLPGPPSLVSSPSPGFQTIVSSPPSPLATSRVPASLLSPIRRSLPSPPFMTSGYSLPVIVSSPRAAVEGDRARRGERGEGGLGHADQRDRVRAGVAGHGDLRQGGRSRAADGRAVDGHVRAVARRS